MSDFAQNGGVCTLQRLNDSHLGKIDSDWLPSLKDRPQISLILPCHAPDLSGPALLPLCRELGSAPWIDRVIVPINGLPPHLLPEIREFFSTNLSIRHTVFSTDTPNVTAVLSEASNSSPITLPRGKGLNVWAAMGLLLAHNTSGIFVLQDCDVLSFQRSTLARLCFSLAEPSFDFHFAKMYYSRVTDRLYGRVSRLFLAPLLHALVRVAGHHPLLDFIQSFRYPLAGECAIRSSLAGKLPIGNGWSLEISMLASIFREIEPVNICQVDGGIGYDHKHQPASGSLELMCSQIANTLLHQLAVEGCNVDVPFLESVSRVLHRECSEAVKRSYALARINGIRTHLDEERQVAEAFAQCLPKKPTPPQILLPSWETVHRGHPNMLEMLVAATEADRQREF